MAVRTGGSGADLFDASLLGDYDETNQYSGSSGDDTLIGGALKDRLVGGEGSDVLTGDDGSDTLIERGVSGNDRLDGAEGDDNIEGRYGSDTLIGGAGHDTITFGFGSMLVSGGAGDDTFVSIGRGPASATITGGAGDDVLDAGASADSFDGGQGEDLVDYSATRTGIVVNFQTGATGGGAAGDTFRFVEDVIGTDLSDVILGNGAYNVILGGAGDDTLGGGFGGDYLDGGDGFDVVDLGAGGSTGVMANLASMTFAGGGADGDTLLNFEGLAGSDLADALRGDAGANLLIGRAGADTLTGAEGADTMVGGLGFDLYRVGDLADSLVEDAAAGVDTVEATIDYSLAGAANIENLNLVGPSALSGTGNGLTNIIAGNEFDNALDGGAGADTMIGGKGDDSYYVDAGGDRINEEFEAGSFNQVFAIVNFDIGTQTANASYIQRVTLIGDADFVSEYNFTGEAIGSSGDNRFTIRGDATFTGAEGSDAFYFATRSESDAAVTDYAKGDDVIELNAANFGLSAGPLDQDAFRLGLSAADADDRVIYFEALGQLYIDKDGDGRRFDAVLIGTFEPGLALRADDFVVV